MIGQTISHYKVIEKLGAGGMGEVYLAEDSRLDRKVALKILPQHLSDKAELRERFEREARAVSSLNHPHICTLYDIGEQDGIHYLVMEHLVGETLEARLAKGALPLEQTLEYAIQIADALDKAHRQGVVHRDLKPGNIMLVKSGAKLLDFGLAKLQAADTPTNLSSLPTEQANLTAEGTILGTLQYMAPEQLEGKEADSRTDIFAFGAVVYEMATGKKAFEGKSQASLIAAIMGQDPRPMAELQPMTPQLLDRVVKRCLAKDLDERWQTAADLMAELKWVVEGGSQPDIPAPVVSRRRNRERLTLGLASLVVGVLVTLVVVWNLSPSPTPRPITRFALTLPQNEALTSLLLSSVAISPDGTHLAYVANNQLYLRAIEELETNPIPGTEDARGPFFSPDGQWLGFFADDKLKKVSIRAGSAQTLCDAPNPPGASWGPDNTIVFGRGGEGIWQVSAAGGTPQVVIRPDPEQIEIYGGSPPELLPGGKAMLFTIKSVAVDWDDAKIVVQQLETGERKVVIEGGKHARYVPTGHLVYARASTLLAVPFDLERLEVTGAPVPVVGGVMESSAYSRGVADFSISKNGSLVYVPMGEQEAQRTLVWVDRKGAVEPLAALPRTYTHPRLSPDGRRLSVAIQEANSDIWVYDIARSTLTRLTFEANNILPIWTPDGKRVAFSSDRAGGPRNLFWRPADGSGGVERLATSELIQQPLSWSPDGQVMAFLELHPTNLPDIWVLPLEGERKPQPFLRSPFNEGGAMFSPDGDWLAYHEIGQFTDPEVYVQPYPGPGGKRQISTDGGTEPVWNPNGRELFYRNGDKMMAVDVTTEPSFNAGTPRLLFEGRYGRDSFDRTYYDVTPDGQRFVMVKAGETLAPAQINITLNWFEELKRLVPTGN